jgi:hypothetical protein
MKTKIIACFTLVLGCSFAGAFEGRISAALTRGGETQTLLYTVGTNQLRIERSEAERPYAKNIFSLESGAPTLLFPHNRSYVRLKDAGIHAPTPFPVTSSAGAGPQPRPKAPGAGALPPPPGRIGPANTPGMSPMPGLPQLPPGIGPQAGGPGGAGATVPTMQLPMMPMQQMELKATTDTTNLLGYVCARYELKQRGEVMEIWATDQLLAFQPYLQNQPPRFGPRMMEERWSGLLRDRKLFPLLAVLRIEHPSASAEGSPLVAGPERLRFEVRSIAPERIADDTLFQPPADYHEIQPLPF